MATINVTNTEKSIIVQMKSEGPQGDPGETGAGFPSGGQAGQILAKNSSTSQDTSWVDITSRQLRYIRRYALALG